MGPEHAVLANSDLLMMIFSARSDSYYKRNELFQLALVCRKFSAVALDMLWNTVYSIGQICFLFPKDIISTNAENTKLFSRTPVTRDQWARFETYAWRIRTIRVIFPQDQDPYMVLERHPSHRHPFAHLTCLQWYSDVPSVSHATLMICSTLVDISFRLDGIGPDDATADIMQAVKETCTHLREFEFNLDGEFIPTSTTFETSLASLLRSSVYLRKVTVPTNCRVLDSLALLPSLHQLFLSQPSKSDENGWNVTYPVVSESPDQETFEALEWLNIWSTFTSISSMHLFLQPFRKIASKPRVYLKVRIDSEEPHTSAETPRHFYDALPPNLRIGLEVFCIYQNWGRNDIPPVHSWQSFSWLLESPNLQLLSLSDHLLEIDDTIFAQTAQKWPELTSLRLVISDRSVDPRATFHGLVQLSLFPKLQHLYITIGSNCTIAPSLLYGEQVSGSPLPDLYLPGQFPNADTRQVALFLVKHFPNLKSFQTGPEPQWLEVKSRMKFLRKVLPEIPGGHARLTSG